MNNANELKNSNESDNLIPEGRNNKYYCSNKENNKPILVLSIEISQGEKELLRIYSDSEPEKLAYEFCTKHHLDYNSLQLLSDQIRSIIQGNINRTAHIREDNSNSLKSSNVSSSSINIHRNMTNAKRLHSSQKNINNNSNRGSNVTIRHNLSYLIPTCSSRSKSIKCSHTSPKEPNESVLTEKPIRNKAPLSQHNSKYLNTGERLYFKGKKLQEKKEEKIDSIKRQLIQSRSTIYTFKPKINTITNEAMRNRITNGLTYNDDKKILNYNKYLSNKITSLKEKHCDNSEYTFTPLISKKSNQIDQAKQKAPNVSRHELLYDNYKKQQVNLEALSNQIYDVNVLFKPQINDNSSSQYSNIPFEERQKFFINKQAEKKRMLREQLESPEDEKTGQKLFHPEINNDYYMNRDRVGAYHSNANGYNIFNSLYTEALRTQQRKRQIEENKIIEGHINSNCSHVNVDSEDIYENKKAKCFQQIFALLDRDKDGIITKRSIDIKALPNQIINILSPIIEELRVEDETLNEDEFITACFHLFDMLEYIEKKQLLTFTMSNNTHNTNNYSLTSKGN